MHSIDAAVASNRSTKREADLIKGFSAERKFVHYCEMLFAPLSRLPRYISDINILQ